MKCNSEETEYINDPNITLGTHPNSAIRRPNNNDISQDEGLLQASMHSSQNNNTTTVKFAEKQPDEFGKPP